MSPAQWRRIQQLFERALELDAPDREDYLQRIASASPIEHDVVVSLLAANAEIDRIERRSRARKARRR